jgi:heterodisulfide reductase subunit A-like polyferredoxin
MSWSFVDMNDERASSEHDVAVLGGGAAGLSAALVLVVHAVESSSSTPGSRARHRPHTCMDISPATACRPLSCSPPAA